MTYPSDTHCHASRRKIPGSQCRILRENATGSGRFGTWNSVGRIWILLGLLLVCVMNLAGCDRATSLSTAPSMQRTRQSADGPYTIIATTAMVADIVKHVAGENASVITLMGAGVDPHLYRPTRSDIAAILNADVVFYNGLNLEGRMTDLFIRAANAGVPVYAVTELIDESYLLSLADAEGHDDPHVWMDPQGWMKATAAAAAKLSEFDPSNADTYRANAEAYIAELEKLDAYARQRLATVPPDRRVLVTAHDAFNYFARAYDIEVRGIQGISTDSEAGLRQIESLIDLLVTRQIPAVFTESSVSDKNVRALVEGAHARGHAVVMGGELFSDAMGEEGTYEGTYIGMMDHNITTIVRALGGEAPPRGMNNRLGEHHDEAAKEGGKAG